MNKEQLLQDSSFLAWYAKSDQSAIDLWERRMKENPALTQVVEEAVMTLLLQDVEEKVPSEEKLVREREKLLRAIASIEGDEVEVRKLERKKYYSWVAAASVVLVLACYWVVQMVSNARLVYETATHEVREIELPDQSIVTLNNNSTLRIDKVWSNEDTIRQVWLEGEAFFTVQKAANKSKFIVHSGDLQVEVLGTSFNVNSTANATTVVLATGKVQLSQKGKDDKIVMKPGDMAEYKGRSGEIVSKQVNTEVFTAWKDGRMVFENASIAEIADLLAKRYGLQVNYEAVSNSDNEFNGTFPIDDVSVLLDALSKTYQWDVQREGKHITLRPR